VNRDSGTLVAVLERRGRNLRATPLFESGRWLTVPRDRRAGPGDMVLVSGSGAGAARSCAGSAGPTSLAM